MKFTELQQKTNKLHYMIYEIFANNDNEEANIDIERVLENQYRVRLTHPADESYNCTVNINITKNENYAMCDVLPDDKFCDEAQFVFQYAQPIPMHYDIMYI